MNKRVRCSECGKIRILSKYRINPTGHSCSFKKFCCERHGRVTDIIYGTHIKEFGGKKIIGHRRHRCVCGRELMERVCEGVFMPVKNGC